MEEFGALTGRRYDVVMPYRLEDAEYAIVGSGCMMETAEAAVDYMRERLGLKVGLLHITCFRPFPVGGNRACAAARQSHGRHRAAGHPDDAVEPAALRNQGGVRRRHGGHAGLSAPSTRMPRFTGGSAGLGSRDVRAGDFIAMVENMRSPQPRHYFTVGIKHETALAVTIDPDVRSPGSFSMRGHSVGGYGSVTTNKVIATIAGEVFGMDVQAYPKYGSEKKGLPTTYYLTVASRAHPRALRARARGVHRAERRQRLQPGEPADGDLRRRHGLRAEPEDRPGGDLGVDSGLGAQDHVRQERAPVRAGHGGDRAKKSPRAPTCSSACRASCCWASSCASRPSRRSWHSATKTSFTAWKSRSASISASAASAWCRTT